MNLGERQAYYRERGFEDKDAATCVLLELGLQSLAGTFPDLFVCFGGATLVLLYGSSRVSADLDLLVNADNIPSAGEVIAAVSGPLGDASQELGLGALQFSVLLSGADHFKIAVANPFERLFTLDVSRISGTIHSEVTKARLSIASVPSATASFVSQNWLLMQKAEAFLTRRVLKVRDAFDIKLLLDSGAVLSDNLNAHLADGPASERLDDSEFIRRRIAALTPQRCQLELRPVLPETVYQKLEDAKFAPLRDAVQAVLADWLED